jgi:hypothetical protein
MQCIAHFQFKTEGDSHWSKEDVIDGLETSSSTSIHRENLTLMDSACHINWHKSEEVYCFV